MENAWGKGYKKTCPKQSLLGQDNNLSCGATRLDAFAPTHRIPSYADTV